MGHRMLTSYSALDALERSDNERMEEPKVPVEIDFKTCRRYGPSYRGLPKNVSPPHETLNIVLIDQVRPILMFGSYAPL